MGVLLSLSKPGPAQLRVINRVPDREVAPLGTLDELLNFKDEPLLCAVEPLSDAIKRGKPGEPRTIFCHDMDNNYKEDRFIHGTDEANLYRFHHWQIIDTFIYYSHYMVTIPPPGWISAAHRHGVKVLGKKCRTTQNLHPGDDGIKTINTVRGSGLTPQVATQLAKVATVGRFDGWLVSIGCKMDRSCIPFVIWYDAVDVDGNAKPHNELNQKNAAFLDLCDGIFLNFHWTEAMLLSSAQLAGNRKADVYVGVDVYGRKTTYAGGFEMYKAVQRVRRCGLSAAVFAAGLGVRDAREEELCETPIPALELSGQLLLRLASHQASAVHEFLPGFRFQAVRGRPGRSFSLNASVTLPITGACLAAWFNLHKQQLQPRDQGNALCNSCCSVKLHLEEAYNGGGCLRVLFKPNRNDPDVKPYIRLFGCDFPLGPLAVSYTFKNISFTSSVGQDIAIVLKARSAAGETEEIYLGMTAGLPEGDNYTVSREIIRRLEGDEENPRTCWLTRKYQLEDLRGADGAILEEIGLHFFCTEKETNVCLLGQLDVKRPAEALEAVSGGKSTEEAIDNDSNSDDEPERKRLRDEQYGLDAVIAE
ncbi:hypothetical protein MTO96_028030 [Rhipicephalus appendiculatus]